MIIIILKERRKFIMNNEKEVRGNIDIAVGNFFEIKLDSQACSTGYSWVLAHMPDCVNLIDVSIESSHSHILGASETQVFTFVAVKETTDYVKFNLLRPFSPEKIADSRTYELQIGPKCEADEAEKVAGCRMFATMLDVSCPKTDEMQMLYMVPVLHHNYKYMAPAMITGNSPSVGTVKYMPPIIMKYMAPCDCQKDKEE